jgi:hypothetical protein
MVLDQAVNNQIPRINMWYAVVYGKAVDDKQLGVYLDGIYFGGMSDDKSEADKIATECSNNTRGGVAICKVVPIECENTLPSLLDKLRDQYAKIERDMINTEDIITDNAAKSKKRRKPK